MASRRYSVQDFIAQVNAQTPGVKTGNTYSATLNSDGSVTITSTVPSTDVSTVLYANVWWQVGRAGAVTDTNINGDIVTIRQNDKSIATADAQLFINNLN